MDLKISALKVFIAVVDCGNIQAAADKVNRSVSAISMTLKQLEDSLGEALFETDRKNQLTALGQYLYDTAQAQVRDYDKAMVNIQCFAKGELGKVHLAAIPSVAAYLLPENLKSFLKKHPHVEIELRDMDSATVTRWVEQGRIDFGIGGRAAHNINVKFCPLFEDELVLVYPLSLPLGGRSHPIKTKEILKYPCLTNGVIANAEQDDLKQFHENARLHVHNTASLLALIRAGVGVTILPRQTIPENDMGLGIAEIELSYSTREVGLIYTDQALKAPAVKLFFDHLKAELSSSNI